MADTKEIRFDNDYHGTRSFARARRVGLNSGRECRAITARVMRRVHRDLCGVDGCTCGGLRGEQGGTLDNIVLARDAWDAYQAHLAHGGLGESGKVVVGH